MVLGEHEAHFVVGIMLYVLTDDVVGRCGIPLLPGNAVSPDALFGTCGTGEPVERVIGHEFLILWEVSIGSLGY